MGFLSYLNKQYVITNKTSYHNKQNKLKKLAQNAIIIGRGHSKIFVCNGVAITILYISLIKILHLIGVFSVFGLFSVERRRRYNINDRIKELGTLLPSSIPP